MSFQKAAPWGAVDGPGKMLDFEPSALFEGNRREAFDWYSLYFRFYKGWLLNGCET